MAKAKIFISHSSHDKKFCNSLLEGTDKERFWLDSHELELGDPLPTAIADSLTEGQNSAKKQEQERDEMLLRLLKTPPQPRPKRERNKSVQPKGGKPKKKTPAK